MRNNTTNKKPQNTKGAASTKNGSARSTKDDSSKQVNNNRSASKPANNRSVRKEDTVPSSNQSERTEPIEAKRRSAACRNDAAWYIPSPQQLKDAASLVWAEISGLKAPDLYEVNPGMMIYKFRAIPGKNTSANDPVNVASQKLFTYIRHSNSGNYKNYDNAFVMMYLYAMDQICMLWEEATRAYGLINAYSSQNRYFPRYLLSSLGWNFNDLQKHIVDFRAYMNQVAAKISTLAIPAVLPMFSRHLWMTTGVYADSDKETSQLFAFVPTGYYQYSYNLSGDDPEAPNELDGLVFKSRPSTFNFQSFVSMMDSLVDSVWMNTDFGILSGDILKAFGGNVFTLPEIGEEYAIFPGFNGEVMTQIQNMRTVPEHWVLEDANFIYQEPGAFGNNILLFAPSIVTTGLVSDAAEREDYANAVNTIMGPNSFKVYTTPISDPTPEDNMVATRLIFYCDQPTALEGDHFKAKISSVGTEIVERADMWSLVYQKDPNSDYEVVAISTYPANSMVCLNGDPTKLRVLSRISKFDWHHEIWFSQDYASGQWQSCVDVDKYTYVPTHTIKKLNDCALQGEYGIGLLSAWGLVKGKSAE